MRKITRTLFNKILTWVASTTATLELPLDRYISAVLLRFDVTYTTAGGAGTVAQDGVLNIAKRISLKVGSKTIRSWDPARKWYTIPLDLKTKPEFVNFTTPDGAGKKAQFVLPIYFRLDPKNDNDASALLPAHLLSSATIEIEWESATGNYGTGQTVTAATCTATLMERVLSTGEELSVYGASGKDVVGKNSRLTQILETEVTKTVDAAYADFGFPIGLPAGHILTRTFVFATLAGARDDTLIDKIRVRTESPEKSDLIEEEWEISQARDLVEYEVATPIEGNRYLTGFTVLDFAEFGNLDMRGRKKDDVTLNLTTAAPSGTTNVVLLHEQLESYGA